jgi:queuine/archaeosine tRNA-ribosyltransferase
MKLDKISYIPVLNGSILNCALRDDMFVNGKRITFYTKDSLFKYGKYLINPFHHSKIFEQIKAKELLIDEGICFSDSGGLQEITLGEVRYSPEEVFKWQQENTHIGFSVDSLPFITGSDNNTTPGSFGGWKFDKANFAKHALKSKENIDVTKKYRDMNKPFNFYGIIQGRQYNEYLKWYEILRDDAYLDGYCCKAPNVNPMTLAETSIFVMNNLTKPVHFLGIGNISRAIILYYANKYIKQPISYDSSSYDIGTQYRSYLLPFMFNKKVRFVSHHNLGEDSEVCNANDVVHIEDVSKICDCDACKAMSNTKELIDNNSPKLGSLLSLHNLILNLKINEYVQSIINNQYKLREFVNFNFEPSLVKKILDAFDMIDLSVEKGVEYALNKYKDNMQLNQSTGNQKTIFNI